MKDFSIGSKKVGEGNPTYIIAEMSANHCGSYEKALAILKKAKEIGADAVKIQTYRPDTITLNSKKEDFCIPVDNPWHESKTLFDLYEKAYTPWDWHEGLFREAEKIGIQIFSSPFDESAVDLLMDLNAPVYKIASPEITHIPLLQKVAKTNKPVILSSGVASLEDLDLAVETLRENGCDEIAILKCTSSYPAPMKSMNLKTIPYFSERYNCLSGLSDHTLGIGVPIASVALGASIIEKHFILDKNDNSVDGSFSLDPKEFGEMITEVRNIESALGEISSNLDGETRKNAWGRRSLYVSKNIKKGEALTSENIKCVRPSFGLHPKYYNEVLGKVAGKDLEVGDRLSLDFIK